MDSSNTSNDTHSNNGRDTKRQQFSNKQRMDMYAFCVLELEMHSNRVSIKKQQLAIQKVLSGQQKGANTTSTRQQQAQQSEQNHHHQLQQLDLGVLNANQLADNSLVLHNMQQANNSLDQLGTASSHSTSQNDQQQQVNQAQQNGQVVVVVEQRPEHNERQDNQNDCLSLSIESGADESGKTLLQLQQEVAMTRKCYSDYQRTQVLTSSMLRDVQIRFAKYYPNSAIPSRTTIKHVFEKCVAHGTVENIKTQRKATRIPQADEINRLLITEPQLSLRQLAQKMNVSTGTISRRCKALGVIPESVTLKHQQLATARRQRQMKELKSQSKAAAAEVVLPPLSACSEEGRGGGGGGGGGKVAAST